MEVEKVASGSLINTIVKSWIGPYDSSISNEQSELTITTGPGPGTTIAPLSGLTRAWISIRNTSPAGQQIRFGPGTPSFTGGSVSGMLLLPGEEWHVFDCRVQLEAIANIAGATLSRFIIRSSGI